MTKMGKVVSVAWVEVNDKNWRLDACQLVILANLLSDGQVWRVIINGDSKKECAELSVAKQYVEDLFGIADDSVNNIDRFRDALQAGRVEFSDRAARAVSNLDLQHPDRTLTSVNVHFWGPSDRNGGGMGIDYEFHTAGCGRCDFYIEDGRLHCYNQSEDKAFIRTLFQFILDHTELDDPTWEELRKQ